MAAPRLAVPVGVEVEGTHDPPPVAVPAVVSLPNTPVLFGETNAQVSCASVVTVAELQVFWV